MDTINSSKQDALSAVPPEETFDSTWPFESRYTEAPGFRMHYVDEGEGETVLALHGARDNQRDGCTE